MYVLLTGLVNKVENDFRRDFDLPEVTIRDGLLSLALGATCLAFLYVMLMVVHEKLPLASFLPICAAAQALRGTWRVDRQLLVIPDRFQLLGLLSGASYVLILIFTGEDSQELAANVGIGLALTGLLWLMSAIYFRVRGKVGFGFGDVKLLGWLALFFGHRIAPIVFIAVLVNFTELIFIFLKKSITSKKLILPSGPDTFAFGPSIVLATVIEMIIHYA
jgi:prepilin signal peptidase PulO-like enzyme (type II secretory pathway)